MAKCQAPSAKCQASIDWRDGHASAAALVVSNLSTVHFVRCALTCGTCAGCDPLSPHESKVARWPACTKVLAVAAEEAVVAVGAVLLLAVERSSRGESSIMEGPEVKRHHGYKIPFDSFSHKALNTAATSL